MFSSRCILCRKSPTKVLSSLHEESMWHFTSMHWIEIDITVCSCNYKKVCYAIDNAWLLPNNKALSEDAVWICIGSKMCGNFFMEPN